MARRFFGYRWKVLLQWWNLIPGHCYFSTPRPTYCSLPAYPTRSFCTRSNIFVHRNENRINSRKIQNFCPFYLKKFLIFSVKSPFFGKLTMSRPTLIAARDCGYAVTVTVMRMRPLPPPNARDKQKSHQRVQQNHPLCIPVVLAKVHHGY